MNTLSDWKSGSGRRAYQMIIGAALALVFLVLPACSGQTSKPEDPGKELVKRAQNRWDTLLAGDYESAFAYYSPGYRSKTTMIDFAIDIRSRPVKWTSAEYLDHNCGENSCKVRFNVDFVVYRPLPGVDKWENSNVIEDNWVKTGGEWWYFPIKQ